MSTRAAKHAGSWYLNSGPELAQQLEIWLLNANLLHWPARAIITPHAGYEYSGRCAAFGYKQINPSLVNRIFILGPSHHYDLNTCALSTVKKVETPLYDLDIDLEVNQELHSSGHFEWLDLAVDENEHSIELQLPYVAKIMENYRGKFKIIPILVGKLDMQQQTLYGEILAEYFNDPQTIFIISSDFCHWGPEYDYVEMDPSYRRIHEYIAKLDRMGMDKIENINAVGFRDYLNISKNTICGSDAILVFLQALATYLRENPTTVANMKFLNYQQSHQCLRMDDNSVSYAAGSLILG